MVDDATRYLKAGDTYYRITCASATEIVTVLVSGSKYKGRAFTWTRDEVRANVAAGVIAITPIGPSTQETAAKGKRAKGGSLWK